MAQKKIVVTENILRQMEHVEKGTLLTVEAEEANLLIGCQRAREATDEEIEADNKKKK